MENKDKQCQASEFQDYLIILHENQISIQHLAKNVEKLSLYLDKMVEKQTEMLIQHKELNVVKKEYEDLEERVKKIENFWSWSIKTVAGAIVTIAVGVIIYSIKGGGS